MIRPVDGIPIFATATRADHVLQETTGAEAHIPHPASIYGLKAQAKEMASTEFPRSEVSQLLTSMQEDLGACESAIDNAKLLAQDDTLVVVTGQQPMNSVGPLYILYKIITTIKLAQVASEELGVPVVPIFWNASEDHDIDEVAEARTHTISEPRDRIKAQLDNWRGKPIASIDHDDVWAEPINEWLAHLPDITAQDFVAKFNVKAGESWSNWISRAVVELFAPWGLVVMQPQPLRPLAREFFKRVVEEHAEVTDLIRKSCENRPGASNFTDIGGPALFSEKDGKRRRILASGSEFRLRGIENPLTGSELISQIENNPEHFSPHAALRPIIQNALLPVVASVVGPGEISYHEELYHLHNSPLGAARRMPILWPRLSATILDKRSKSTMKNFGISHTEAFLAEAQLVQKFTPQGDIAPKVRTIAAGSAEALRAIGREAEALDSNLVRPLAKTLNTFRNAMRIFSDKVEASEARLKGFAPEKLAELSNWIRPQGRLQERTANAVAILAAYDTAMPEKLIKELDVTDHRHKLIFTGEDKRDES